ncbi:hypothetical protein [Micromonospora sp. RV43]|uniref:hypothetical protein n=1 Tax=Micromonospora sp. RV43 TaxID=1661387 RepID=UPI00064BEC90|nr:hypothetical protein [Micromonospora sp. RV43]
MTTQTGRAPAKQRPIKVKPLTWLGRPWRNRAFLHPLFGALVVAALGSGIETVRNVGQYPTWGLALVTVFVGVVATFAGVLSAAGEKFADVARLYMGATGAASGAWLTVVAIMQMYGVIPLLIWAGGLAPLGFPEGSLRGLLLFGVRSPHPAGDAAQHVADRPGERRQRHRQQRAETDDAQDAREAGRPAAPPRSDDRAADLPSSPAGRPDGDGGQTTAEAAADAGPAAAPSLPSGVGSGGSLLQPLAELTDAVLLPCGAHRLTATAQSLAQTADDGQ